MLIDRSIKKYGVDNFDYIICNVPIEFLDQFEKDMILKLNTLSPNGYNLTTGGNKNKKQHKDTKIKISIFYYQLNM